MVLSLGALARADRTAIQGGDVAMLDLEPPDIFEPPNPQPQQELDAPEISSNKCVYICAVVNVAGMSCIILAHLALAAASTMYR